MCSKSRVFRFDPVGVYTHSTRGRDSDPTVAIEPGLSIKKNRLLQQLKTGGGLGGIRFIAWISISAYIIHPILKFIFRI